MREQTPSERNRSPGGPEGRGHTLEFWKRQPTKRDVEEYAKWLEAKQLKWSSIANYLAALVSAATFATVEMETPPPLDQLANLRRQAEKMAREETLYRKKAANWIGALAMEARLVHS